MLRFSASMVLLYLRLLARWKNASWSSYNCIVKHSQLTGNFTTSYISALLFSIDLLLKTFVIILGRSTDKSRPSKEKTYIEHGGKIFVAESRLVRTPPFSWLEKQNHACAQISAGGAFYNAPAGVTIAIMWWLIVSLIEPGRTAKELCTKVNLNFDHFIFPDGCVKFKFSPRKGGFPLLSSSCRSTCDMELCPRSLLCTLSLW